MKTFNQVRFFWLYLDHLLIYRYLYIFYTYHIYYIYIIVYNSFYIYIIKQTKMCMWHRAVCIFVHVKHPPPRRVNIYFFFTLITHMICWIFFYNIIIATNILYYAFISISLIFYAARSRSTFWRIFSIHHETTRNARK